MPELTREQIEQLQRQCELRAHALSQQDRIIAAQNRELQELRAQNARMKKALNRVVALGAIAFEAIHNTSQHIPDIEPFEETA